MSEDEHTAEQIEVTQKAAIGSQSTQIGVQNNFGLSVHDVVEAAVELFRQYYPQLRDDALSEVRAIVEEEMNGVKNENIIPPKAKVAIPLLQNASITEETTLRRIYAKLLASSMNNITAVDIHPAFIHIINQLSEQDAFLLKRINDINDSIPVAHIKFTFDTRYLTKILPHFYSPYFSDLGNMEAVSISIENLSRLQLINLFEGRVLSYDYEQIKSDSYIQERFSFARENDPGRDLKIELSNYTIQSCDFGKRFIECCIPNNL